MAEPLALEEVKEYLRVLSSDEDSKIAAMIPRARLWVEDFTGLALVQREFVETRVPQYGAIRLNKAPLVSVEPVVYTDGTYEPLTYPPDATLYASADSTWPTLATDGRFTVTYVAGYADGEVDDRLLGAMYALIEGEYSEGYAYPERAMEAARGACMAQRQMVA